MVDDKNIVITSSSRSEGILTYKILRIRKKIDIRMERDKIVCGHVDLSQVDKHMEKGRRGEKKKGKGRKTLVLLAQRGY